jgi:hypothetical protein
VLGLSLTLLVFAAAAFAGEHVPGPVVAGLYEALIGVSVFKLLLEASVFSQLRVSQVSDLKRTALLMWGELAKLTQLRFALGLMGGLCLPWLLAAYIDPRLESIQLGVAPLVIAASGFVCLLIGELIERSLFFMAAVSAKMPGAIGQ